MNQLIHRSPIMSKDEKKPKVQTVEQELSEKNAKLESEIRSLKDKIGQEKDSTEMAKMQAQINVLASQQDRTTKLENEYQDRKALYTKNVNKRKAKEAAKAQAIEDIENEVETKEPTPSSKTSEQSTQEAKDFHDEKKPSKSDPGQSLRSPGQGKGPSVVSESEDSKPSTKEPPTGSDS